MLTSAFPETFVPPPLFKNFTQPKLWLRMLKARTHMRLLSWMTTMGVRVQSIPPKHFLPVYRPTKGPLVPTAKALHRSLFEAFARGDMAELRKVAVARLYNSLGEKVQRRAKYRRFEWHLVRYTSRPRLLDHQTEKMPLNEKGTAYMVTRQAVVAIASRQRLVEYDDAKGGAVVSDKEVDLVENVIIMANVDQNTYKTDEWKIWGFADESTWEEYSNTLALAETQKKADEVKQASKLRSTS